MPAAPLLRHPLILVHGLFGFDSFKVVGWEALSYFRGIGESLKSKGIRVAAPRLSPTSGVADCAQQLTDFIRLTFPSKNWDAKACCACSCMILR